MRSSQPRFGVDAFKGKIVDLSSRDIYEPLSVKNQVVNSGTEAACMILRIDDIISAGAPKGVPTLPESRGLWRHARIMANKSSSRK